MLVGLFPELDAPGGVQRAGRHLAAVLSEYAAGRDMDYRFLSLNDSPELHRTAVAGREFVYTGCERGKLRFLTAALRAARRGAKVVLAAHPNLGPVTRAMRVAAPGLKTIVCTHGVEVWEPLPLLRRRALRRSDLVLAPSRDTANQVVVRQGVREERVRVLPWALDPQFEALLSLPQAAALPPGFPRGRVILAVGRWAASERYKGVDHLIAAVARLRTRWPDVQLVAAGEGDDHAWLENLAAEHGVRRQVHFLRGLSPGALAACYAGCEIFALPSRGEGFGLVYLEAMACGKPVIGGAHGGAPEVIEDGVTGYLVPHGDVTQIVTALETLLRDPEHARAMGARGRARVHSQFRFTTFAKSLKKLLHQQCTS